MVLSWLEPIRGSERAASRIARSVAIVIGIALSIGASPIYEGSIEAIDPKVYIRTLLPSTEAKCLIMLYSKESAFNKDAIGNKHGHIQAYGIPQLKNPIIKDLPATQQIDYGMRYIAHRYTGTCAAYTHYKKYGWH